MDIYDLFLLISGRFIQVQLAEKCQRKSQMNGIKRAKRWNKKKSLYQLLSKH